MSRTALADMGGHIPVMRPIIEKLGAMTALVYGEVWTHCQVSRKCKASIDTLAKELNMTSPEVRAQLKILVEKGYLIFKSPHTFIDVYKVENVKSTPYVVSRLTYRKYIKSRRWKAKALEAKIKAGGRCQVCNSKKGLQTHHRTYDNLGNEQPNDLTVLCSKCHKLFSTAR